MATVYCHILSEFPQSKSVVNTKPLEREISPVTIAGCMNMVFSACRASSNTLLTYFLDLLEIQLRDSMKPVTKLTDVVELQLEPKTRQTTSLASARLMEVEHQ